MELYIQEEQISEHLQKRLERFRADYPVADEVKRRVSKPDMPFFGKEILEMAVSALLEGENILLCGIRQPARIFWRKTWHGCSEGPYTTCPSM